MPRPLDMLDIERRLLRTCRLLIATPPDDPELCDVLRRLDGLLRRFEELEPRWKAKLRRHVDSLMSPPPPDEPSVAELLLAVKAWPLPNKLPKPRLQARGNPPSAS